MASCQVLDASQLPIYKIEAFCFFFLHTGAAYVFCATCCSLLLSTPWTCTCLVPARSSASAPPGRHAFPRQALHDEHLS